MAVLDVAGPSTEPVRGRPQFRWAGLVALVGGAVALAVSYWVFVLTAAGRSLDSGWQRGPSDNLLLAGFDRHAIVAELLVSVVVMVLAVRRGIAWRGVLAAALPYVVALEADALQALLRRPDGHNSFPSGHVGLAAATVLALLLVLPTRARPLVGGTGALAVAVVAVATVLAGWHRPSDTLGGVLLAVAVAGAVVLASSGERRPDGQHGGPGIARAAV